MCVVINRGFTLLETTISIVVVGLVLSVMLKVMTVTERVSNRYEDSNYVTMHISGCLEGVDRAMVSLSNEDFRRFYIPDGIRAEEENEVDTGGDHSNFIFINRVVEKAYIHSDYTDRNSMYKVTCRVSYKGIEESGYLYVTK